MNLISYEERKAMMGLLHSVKVNSLEFLRVLKHRTQMKIRKLQKRRGWIEIK